jgi:hypothetical protein
MGYSCARCQYACERASDMKKHLARKLPCPPIYDDAEPSDIAATMFKTFSKDLQCAYCDKCFSSPSSRSNHVKLVHSAAAAETQEHDPVQPQLATLQAQMKLVQERLARLDDAKTKSTMHIGQQQLAESITNNTQHNIVINAFGSEALEHITPEFIDQCVRRRNKGLVELIEKIHFDQEHPENNNLRATNIKLPFIKYNDGRMWKLARKDKLLDQLVDKGHGIMQDHFDDCEETIRDTISETMFDHVRRWLDKMQEKDKKTWEDVLTDIYILIVNATAAASASDDALV